MSDMANFSVISIVDSTAKSFTPVLVVVANPVHAYLGVVDWGFRELDRLHVAVQKLFLPQTNPLKSTFSSLPLFSQLFTSVCE